MTKKVASKSVKRSGSGPTKAIQKSRCSSNEEIINGLLKMQHNYQIEGNHGKVLGYQRAIAGIRSIKQPIVSID